MTTSLCIDCLETFKGDKYLPQRCPTCFKRHIKTVGLKFTYGKEDFHGPTIRERIVQTEADALANGITAEPVGGKYF